ncbi:MAG: hypothetical protein IJE73_05885 [Muribaculaceae bacterium]|nr:hypothetical protein [Muribaculaceae bacterium]
MKRFSILSIVIYVALFFTYSCKCAQNTTTMEKKEQTKTKKQPIILDDATDEYSATLNDELYYTHEVHASVGSSYYAEFDSSAFLMRSAMKFNNPASERAITCGGDRGKKTSIFIPQKTGNYEIKIYHNFRGEITDSLTFKVNVK